MAITIAFEKRHSTWSLKTRVVGTKNKEASGQAGSAQTLILARTVELEPDAPSIEVFGEAQIGMLQLVAL